MKLMKIYLLYLFLKLIIDFDSEKKFIVKIK